MNLQTCHHESACEAGLAAETIAKLSGSGDRIERACLGFPRAHAIHSGLQEGNLPSVAADSSNLSTHLRVYCALLDGIGEMHVLPVKNLFEDGQRQASDANGPDLALLL